MEIMTLYEVISLVIALLALILSWYNHREVKRIKEVANVKGGSILSGTFVGNTGGHGSFGGRY